MNHGATGILRMFLLLVGAVIAALVVYLGSQALVASQTSELQRLKTQGIALILIGAGCLLGIGLSAVVPQRLASQTRLRTGLIVIALAIPIVDIYALLPNGGINRTLIGHVVVSALAGLLVALAIATAWLRIFRKT